jgi:hypothetical protein
LKTLNNSNESASDIQLPGASQSSLT